MGTYTKNLKLETPNYTDNADIPALAKKNNEIIDSEMIKRANGLDYNEQTGVLQLTGNNSKVGSPIQIKNNLPVTSMASGTELKVNNYKQLIKFSKEGKTEQKSYTGKNILDYISNLKASSDGLTSVINDDGSITTSGKPTSNYRTILNSINIIDFLEDGETYTFSQSKANDKLYMQMNAKKKDGTYSYYSLNDSTKSKQEIIVNKSIYETYTLNIQTGLTSDWGDSSLTITNKYMLCKGTDTVDISFEPYVGGQSSPNPDYPQKIKNVRGVENIWFGGESTTKNGITFTKNADGSYDITGTATASADCINLVNIANAKLKNGINYNLSINKLTNEKVSILTEAYIENWDSHVIGPLITSTTLSTNKIINIKDNITRVRYVIRVEKGQTVNIKGLKIQLEEGTIAHTFVLPGSNYLLLNNKSNNLANIKDIKIGKNWINVSDSARASILNISVKPNTLYTLDSNININSHLTTIRVVQFDKLGSITHLGIKSGKFVTDNNVNYVSIEILADMTFSKDMLKNVWISLVEGDVAPNIPYFSHDILIDLKGNNLCSDKEQTLKDELVIENGKAKINKKFGEYIFTGNEIFSFADSNTRIKIDSNLLPQLANVYIPQPKTSSNRTPSFCTHYILSSQDNVVKGSNKFAFSQWSNQKFIYFPADYSTIEEFKAKLKSLYDAGTPVIIQYPLSETEGVDLGKIDFDLIENSTLTCEEESDMQIDYLTISSNIFVQDSLDGSSSQKAPSVKAVNEAFDKISSYSSNEQLIGKWINGENLYRKVFEINMDSSSKEMTISTGISNMKQLTHAYGVGLYQNTIYIPLNFYNNLGWDSFHLTGKGASIILQRGDNFPITKVFITLEYTKNV